MRSDTPMLLSRTGRTVMRCRHCICAVAVVAGAASPLVAQATRTDVPAAPTTRSGVPEWDLAIVRRATSLLAAPAQWNRQDSGECAPTATTFSILCALQRAIDEGTGVQARRLSTTSGRSRATPKVECRLQAVE